MATKGKLYLIPAPLGEQAAHTIPQYVIDILHRLDVFIAERAKTARRFIKETDPVKPFSELTFYEITKYTPPEERAQFLEAAENGQDIGLLSEAGCPGVADPGAFVVQTAHQRGIEVVPLVGPSSILLGLMASGLNGQNFCFNGYLPIEKHARLQQLAALEDSVDSANKLFQTARAEYVEVLLAQREMMEARMILIETKQKQLSALVNAYQALGGGSMPNGN